MHWKLKKKNMSNPLKTHQNTLVSHPAPKLPSGSNISTFQDQWINIFYLIWPPLSKHLQQIFHRKIYQNFRYREHHIKIKTAWPPWIFRKSPWETTKLLNCPKTRMFRKDKQFLLHMWHLSCYSIKSFDQRKDRNQDQGNVLMAYKAVIRP